MIRYKKDRDNIATLILDMEAQPLNVINHEIVDAFVPVIQYLKKERSRNALKGVIITSAKRNFLEGGNWEYLYRANDPKEVLTFTNKLKQIFRDIEYPGAPVAAAINGNALGGGFELALACHHRIALDQPKIRLGLPEVSLGLIPGGGGVIRLMWLMGVERAFHLLAQGRTYAPNEALRVGMIDDVANSQKELIEKAKEWLLKSPSKAKPWDTKSKRVNKSSQEILEIIRRLNIELVKEKQMLFPAQHAILNILAESFRLDFDTALSIESRYYTELVCSTTAKNMIRTFGFDRQAIESGEIRPKGFGKFRPKKVGVIGAGLMGSGIATSCAINGLEVVLKDVSRVIAAQGKRIVERNVQELFGKNEIGLEEKNSIINRIQTTESTKDFEDCDLVIEAVFENAAVKQKVTQEAEQYLDEYAFIGSNTLSVPISQLAEASNRPENYVGLHFFHPAQQVPLIEIVKGKKTSSETIARAYDFARAIGKIPIIVRDTWGFYVSRVQNTFILESITMLSEGFPPALIENLGVQVGMPKGGLAFADDLGLPLVLRYEQLAAAHYGNKYIQHPAVAVLNQMIGELNRKGRVNNQGFYEYYENDERKLWQELKHYFPSTKQQYDRTELMERVLFAQVIEAGWCLQEGVIQTTAEANLASVYGWGFPAHKGGVIQFILDYGKAHFLERCQFFEKKYGQRFQIPSFLTKIE
jgi:3-hydroxyacyl-CoA dehydrogenase/enoyl-CoA hydratase/3-hydroxybutyryl-CoA epimerase